jgi:signal peptidase I
MEPTIHCARPAPGCSAARDDKVVVAHLQGVHRGEIVLLRAPERAALVCGGGGFYVKRVIALPGDTWSERAGFVWVDGRKLREPYVKRPRDDRTYATRRVPPHAYIVLGDNRALSCDSRVWGPLPAKDVLARVIKIVRHGGG